MLSKSRKCYNCGDVEHIALSCPKEKGAKLEESLRDSHSRKRFAVQKGRSDTAAVDNDHAEAKTGFLLLVKCSTGTSIGALKYEKTGKVNSQKAMLLRDTGADVGSWQVCARI